MKSVRIAIEWNYGYTAALFRYVGMKYKLKVLGAGTTTKVYCVATIFRNIHVIMNGGQTSNYFDVYFEDGYLLHYVNGTDLN